MTFDFTHYYKVFKKRYFIKIKITVRSTGTGKECGYFTNKLSIIVDVLNFFCFPVCTYMCTIFVRVIMIVRL